MKSAGTSIDRMSWKNSPHVLAPRPRRQYNVAGDLIACREYLIAIEAELGREPNGLARSIPKEFCDPSPGHQNPLYSIYYRLYCRGADSVSRFLQPKKEVSAGEQ